MIPNYEIHAPSEKEVKLTALHSEGLENIERAFQREEIKELYFYFNKENDWELIKFYKKNPALGASKFLAFSMLVRANGGVRKLLGIKNPGIVTELDYPLGRNEEEILDRIIKEERQEDNGGGIDLPQLRQQMEQRQSSTQGVEYPQNLVDPDSKDQEEGIFAGMTEFSNQQDHQQEQQQGDKDATDFINFGDKAQREEERQGTPKEGVVYTEKEETDFIREIENIARRVLREKEKNALGYGKDNPHLFTNPNIFEGITPMFDLEQIRTLKEKGFQMLIFGNLIFFATTIIAILVSAFLALTKENEVYAITFHEPTQSFVSIQRIDKEFKPRDELKKNVLSAYVYDRESINRFDDKDRYDKVKAQSTSEVWRAFSMNFHNKKSIYSRALKTDQELTRRVRIIEVTLSDKNKTAFVVFRAELFRNGKAEYIKDYKAVIKYQFIPQKDVPMDTLRTNPLGFQVSFYNLEVIREFKKPKNVVTEKQIKDNELIKVVPNTDPLQNELQQGYILEGDIEEKDKNQKGQEQSPATPPNPFVRTEKEKKGEPK